MLGCIISNICAATNGADFSGYRENISELLLIDESVPEKMELAKNIRSGIDIRYISSSQLAAVQLRHIFSQYKNLDSVHIVAHAEDGNVKLGSDFLNRETFRNTPSLSNAFSSAMQRNADLLFYGCNLAEGEKGHAFLNYIAEQAGVDVAASTNLTGAKKLGGDWELEYQLGDIRASHPFTNEALINYQHVLPTTTFIGLGGADSGGSGFKSLTDANFTVSNTFDQDGTDIYWNDSVSSATLVIQTDNVDALTADISAINVAGYQSTSPLADSTTTLVFRDAGNSIIRTMTLDSSKSIIDANSGTIDLFSFFDNNNSSPVTGVRSVTLNYVSANNVVPANNANNINFIDFTYTNVVAPSSSDSDGSLTAAGGVSEPVGLDTTLDTVGEAVDVFDFTLSDAGTADGLAMAVSQVVVNVTGTSTDTERGQVTWRLNGNDASNVTGVYNAGADTITFSSLSISIADSGSEVYTVNAYYNDNTSITEDATFILSVDGDTDLTVGGSGTQMGSTSAITNGAGGTFDVVATALAFTTQPAGSTSGSALTTQPVLTARDAFGNTDTDFTETVTLTEASAGSLTNTSVAASSGVATFSGLTYTATADQQSFTLTANDQDGVGSNISTVDASSVTSDVVATQLVYDTQPVPLTVSSGVAASFTTVPVVSARDGNSVVDTGYSTDITVAEVNGAGSATMSGTGDTDGSGATVTLSPSSGVATFTGLQITYTASGGSSENFNLQASSGGLSTVNSSQLTGLVPDSDGSLNAAGGVSEPVGLDTTLDTVGEAADVFDFTLSESGTADGLAMTVSQIVVNVSGTSTDTERGQVTWRLNGNDASNITGVYSAGADTITFSSLSISIADGGSEVYTVNAYYNDNTSITEDATFILSVDGDTDLTLGSGTQMGSTSAITNSTGGTFDVVATALAFTTQPSGSTSGSALTTQPVVTARDAFGNIDTDFTETITLTESSAGSLSGGTSVAASSGVATFSGLTYSATADQQSFTLTANDQDGVGSNLSTVDASAVTSDVVATQLVFDTQPASLTVSSGSATALATVPVVSARDGDNIVDTGYSTGITLAEVNGAGSATMTGTGDTNGSGATVSITPSSGVSTFTGMQITYTVSGGSSENFNLQASSGGLSTANSSQMTGLVPDSDASLTAAGVVTEPVALNFSAETVGEAVNLFDFTLTDGGSADGVATAISAISVNVSGTSSDAERADITWRLNGNDVSNVTGTYNAGSDTLTFTGLSISIADGGSEIYTVNGYYNDNSALTHGNTVILSVDGDTDLTLMSTGTQMASTTAVTNGSGTVLTDDIAPVVTSVSVPGNATYTAAANLDFTVNFNENVVVNTTGGAPRLVLTVGSETRYATYLSGSGTAAIIFRYTVPSDDEDQDGIALTTTLDTNLGTIRDGAGNDMTTSLNSVGSLASVFVDALAPVVAEVTPVTTPGNDSTPNITFSTTEAGNLAVGGSCGSASEGAVSSGNNTIALTQTDNSTALAEGTYTDCTLTVTDSAGNASNALTATSFEVDLTAPAGQGVSFDDTTINDAEASNIAFTFASAEVGSSYTYTISSSGGGTNVTGSGSVSTATDNITGVDVSALNDGTLTLSVTLTDEAGNTATAVTDTASLDTAAPTGQSVSFDDSGINNTEATTAAFTFASAEVGSDYDYTISSSGGGSNVTGSGTLATATDTVSNVDVSGLGDGTLTLSVVLTDDSGNAATAITDTTTLDQTAPVIAEVTAVVTPGNDSTPDIEFSTDEAGTLAVGGSCGSASEGAVSSGNNTIALTQTDNSSALSSGTYSDCTLTVTDGVGNESNELTATSFVVDLVGPNLDTNAGLTVDEGDTGRVIANTALSASDDTSSAAQVEFTLVNAPSNGSLFLGSTELSDGASFTQTDIDANAITYDHDEGETSADNFTFTLADSFDNTNNNASANFTFNISVGAVNDTPVTVSDSAATNEDNAVMVDVLANDSDADNAINAASVTVVTAPSNGTTSVNTSSGVITYTPEADFNGADSFAYTVEDASGAVSAVATVSITVNAQNDAPVAVADTVSTDINTDVSIDVAANDTDVDSADTPDATTVVIVGAASNGVAVFNGTTNQVDYSPGTDFIGSDSFTYTIDDGTGATSNVATVTISVIDPNSAPVAANDSVSTDEDTDVDIQVLANDSDSDGSLIASSVTVVSGASNGETEINTVTGVITYSPAANFNGTDSFTYTVEDDIGAVSSAATVTVTVNAVNDAPVAGGDSVTLLEDASLNINVLGNDTDVDGTLNASTVVVTMEPASGIASVEANGSILYTPVENFGGDDSFTYTVQDDLGLVSNTATVMLSVTPINDVPLANDDSADVVLGEDTNIDLLTNDSDIDGTLDAVSLRIVSQPSQGVAISNNDGSVTYTPQSDADVTLGDSFSYSVEDDAGGESNTATVDIRFIPGAAPVVSGEPPEVLEDGEGYSFTPVVESDPDFDLTYSIENQPSWADFDTSTGILTGTPGSGDRGVIMDVVISVSDGVNTVALPAFDINVISSADTDNDTISDGQEGLDGTDPNDPTDYFDITPPELMAPADILIDATALFTPVSMAQLLSLSENATDTEVDSATATLVSDNVDGDVDGNGCCGVGVREATDGELLFSSGTHTVTWVAEDRMGNSSQVTQNVFIRPLVSTSKDDVGIEGTTVSFGIILNGLAPFYPLEVPYLVDVTSTADSSDHSLVNGIATFEEGQLRADVTIDITTDDMTEADETLVVRLDDRTSSDEDLSSGFEAGIFDINSGANTRYQLTITEQNIAPELALNLQQNGENALMVSPTVGLLTITAIVTDPNPGDTVNFDWSAVDAEVTDTDSDANNNQFVIDPSDLSEGRYRVALTVSDRENASDSASIDFVVVAELPTLSDEADTDNDGIADSAEGSGDSDRDGIPDYLDNISVSNLLPESVNETNAFLIECDPGVRCGLGPISIQGASGGARLSRTEALQVPEFVEDVSFTIEEVFNFDVSDLPEPGQQVKVVIPLTMAIPADAVYRKLIGGNWQDFVEDVNNLVHSTQGSLGFCPPPGDDAWQPGLIEGHLCVQLTIEDGGPNDDDQTANSRISDPGGIGTRNVQSVKTTGGGSFGWWPLLMLLAFVAVRPAKKQATLFGAAMLAMVFSVVPKQVQAFDAENAFAQLSLLSVQGDQTQSKFVSDLGRSGVSAEPTKYDVSRTAFHIAGGYQINQTFSVMLGYADLGEVEVDFDLLAVEDVVLEQALDSSYPRTGKGLTINARAEREFFEHVVGYADLGVFNWDGEFVDVEGTDANLSMDGTDLWFAVGARYLFLERIHVGAEYKRFELDDQSVDGFGLVLGVQFK